MSNSIEVIVNEHIPLKDLLKAIIVPSPFLENLELSIFARNNPDIEILPYPIRYPTSPFRQTETAFSIALDYLIKIRGKELCVMRQ